MCSTRTRISRVISNKTLNTPQYLFVASVNSRLATMLIGLCGPPCAGKNQVAQFLANELGFTILDDPSHLNHTLNSSLASQFPSPHLTSQCWRQNINVVLKNVPPHDSNIAQLLKRPYFLLVYVDAPVLIRFQRSVLKHATDHTQLEQFIRQDDQLRYCANLSLSETSSQHSAVQSLDAAPHQSADQDRCTLADLERMSRLRVVNDYDCVEKLHVALRVIDFTDVHRLRPSWDAYFMALAKLAAERTNCMKRRVGCVIARDKRVVATGYNGTPAKVQNCSEGGCARCNAVNSSQGVALDLCLCLHAEENAIIEAGRDRCHGATLYSNLFPCILCSKKIVQSGIARVVFNDHYASDAAAENLLKAGGVVVDLFYRHDLSNTLNHLILNAAQR